MNRLKADLIDPECRLSAAGRLTRRFQKKPPVLILQPRAKQNLLGEGGASRGGRENKGGRRIETIEEYFLVIVAPIERKKEKL